VSPWVGSLISREPLLPLSPPLSPIVLFTRAGVARHVQQGRSLSFGQRRLGGFFLPTSEDPSVSILLLAPRVLNPCGPPFPPCADLDFSSSFSLLRRLSSPSLVETDEFDIDSVFFFFFFFFPPLPTRVPFSYVFFIPLPKYDLFFPSYPKIP